MKVPTWFAIRSFAAVVTALLAGSCSQPQDADLNQPVDMLVLPTPQYEGQVSVEQALKDRRSIRSYSQQSLTLAEVSQLLWAAQGITNARGGRTAPSAGALYPLEVYFLAAEIDSLPPGIYHYHPDEHALIPLAGGDQRQPLYEAALNQSALREAAGVIAITAVYERTTGKYGQRGIRYAHMEAGTAAQNVYMQAVSLDLGTVFIGAFDDDRVKSVFMLPEQETPLSLMPVGRK